MNFTINQL